MKFPVAVARCADYSRSQRAIFEALEMLYPGSDALKNLFAGKRVLLKVNLMKGMRPESAINTNPEFVAALVRCVRDADGEAMVGDSSGVLGCTVAAFEASGIGQAVHEAGGDVLDFDSCEQVDLPLDGVVLNPDRLKGARFTVPKILFDADILITVPKLKTHTLTGITCALKNQVGAIVGGQKCRIHEFAPTPESLAHAILDIAAALPVRLAIVDAVTGLAGQGMGTPAVPVNAGAVVAGENLVAVDSVCARIAGFSPDEIDMCRLGAGRGMGPCREEEIDLRGDAPAMKFERAGFEPKRFAPFARFYYRTRGRSVKPVVDNLRCSKCGECAEKCPVDAIAMNPFPVIGSGCVRCYLCRAVCPEGAISLRCGRLLRSSFRRKAGDTDTSGVM